ncbi:MAG: hypothetical protein WC623_21840 [Pedobacter sp.]|uniref:hypothetical protein n=1 Tax=Pedobacter sp. TaxID=1411316 RepID=UPI0035690748
MKQYQIDNGELGGLFNVTLTGMAILGLLTFINTFISTYQTFWYKFVSPVQLIIIVIILVPMGLWVVHAFLQPSAAKYAVRQSYTLHNNEMKKDMDEIKKMIMELRKEK